MEKTFVDVLHQVGIDVESRLGIQSLSGGDINQAYLLVSGQQHWFVKRNSVNRSTMFHEERRALAVLSDVAGLKVPAVIGEATDERYSYLVLQYIELTPLTANSFSQAGKALALCHQKTATRFGWHADNFIGTTRQQNPWAEDWFEFFYHYRLLPQFKLLNDASLNKYLLPLQDLNELFNNYSPQPSLLHGDLWGGNVSATITGEPVFYDPASYYGDRETDLAMTELFGGFSSEFYAGYKSVWPLDSGYEMRKPLYQLYHILNHANLFGGHYVEQVRRLLERLI